MAKQKSSKSVAPAASRGDTRRVRLIVLNLLIAGVLIGGGVFGVVKLRQYMDRTLAKPSTTPVIVLKGRPGWMSETHAQQIALSVKPQQITSALDHQLLAKIAAQLGANPWVKEVKRVRRAFGQSAGDTIEIECDFRTPMALVATRAEYILVDSEGVRLPASFPVSQPPRMMFAADGLVNIRIIEGVAALPPAKDGLKWMGDDLKAGLDMVKFLYGRPMADEIHVVNISNFRGRKKPHEAQLVLVTKYQTEIRWGEPLFVTFAAELSKEEKLERLARVREQYGRIDAGRPWIDIRMDKITYPAETATTGG
jgi:cell division septal protein FtsQ